MGRHHERLRAAVERRAYTPSFCLFHNYTSVRSSTYPSTHPHTHPLLHPLLHLCASTTHTTHPHPSYFIPIHPLLHPYLSSFIQFSCILCLSDFSSCSYTLWQRANRFWCNESASSSSLSPRRDSCVDEDDAPLLVRRKNSSAGVLSVPNLNLNRESIQ